MITIAYDNLKTLIMKKRNLTLLKINKQRISTFKSQEISNIVGGWIFYTHHFPGDGNNCPASMLVDDCDIM